MSLEEIKLLKESEDRVEFKEAKKTLTSMEGVDRNKKNAENVILDILLHWQMKVVDV